MPNNTTVYTFAWIRFRRAGQQGPIRTLTAALKRSIKKSLGAYTITQIKLLQTRKTRKINHDEKAASNCRQLKMTAIFRIANKLNSKRFLATGQRKTWLETLSKVAIFRARS